MAREDAPSPGYLGGTCYRGCFMKRGDAVVILLAGGDRRTQAADIRTALRLARNL
jgi:putative addiction module killer protein